MSGIDVVYILQLFVIALSPDKTLAVVRNFQNAAEAVILYKCTSFIYE